MAYVISDACISCGACEGTCPAGAISEGDGQYDGNYSWLIAPAGQPSAQAPQSMHVSASITYCPSPSLIAPAGQVPSQAPQEMQASEITYAIVNILLI